MLPPQSENKDMFNYPEAQVRNENEFSMNEDYNHGFLKRKQKKRLGKEKTSFNLRVISKVNSFAQKMKALAVLQEPKFTRSELEYLTVQGIEKKVQKVSIGYENKFLLCCQIWSYVLFLMILWRATFELVLGNLGKSRYLQGLGLFTCIVFGMLNINSEMKNEKMTLIDEKEKIKDLYMRNSFIPDLLTIIGILLQLTPLSDSNIQIFYISRVLFLALISRTNDIFERIEHKLSVSKERESALLILKLILKVIIALHFLSLILILMSKLEHLDGVKITWVEKSGFERVQKHELYLYAWYWSCTIISTVGFGDITPGNPFQSAFISILEIFSCIIFGYFINYIGSLLNIFGESKAQFEQEIRRLNNYLQRLQITDDLRDEARSTLFNKYKALQLYDKIGEEEIHKNLSENMRESLLSQNNFNFLRNSKLNDVFSEDFLKEIANNLEKTVIPSDEYLFEENSDQLNLWVVEDGVFEEIPTKSLPLKPLSVYDKKKNTIGWINFIKDSLYSSSVVSKCFCVVYKLKKEIFKKTLKRFTKDFFKKCEWKEKLIEKGKKYDNTCLGCGKVSHNVINCPRLHFIPKKINFILEKGRNLLQLDEKNYRKMTGKKRRQKKSYWGYGSFSLNEEKFSCRSSFLQNFFTIQLKTLMEEDLMVDDSDEGYENEIIQPSKIGQRKRLKTAKKSQKSLKNETQNCEEIESIKTYKSSQSEPKQKILQSIDFALVEEEKFRPNNEWEKVINDFHKYKGKSEFKVSKKCKKAKK